MKSKLSYIISGQGVITVILDGKTGQVHPRTPFYDEILVAVKARDCEKYRELSNIKKRLELVSKARISFANGSFTLDGREMHNAMTKRFVRLVEDGHDMEPFMAFIKNCLLNPRQEAIQELYTFLEHNDLPITEDGCFLAYKKVREDYYDCFSGKILNSPDLVVKMPRNEVDQSRKVCNSAGLHVCSKAYADQYYAASKNIILVKVNPRDVCSVPEDHNNTKMRVCEYYILPNKEQFKIDSCEQSAVFVTATNPSKFKRDSRGRFCS